MGNSTSGKGKKKDKKGSDDGCIGNRRVRTILIACLLVAFCVFAFPYVQAVQEYFDEAKDSILGGLDIDYIEDGYNAWTVTMAGMIIMVCAAIAAAVLFFIPGCEDNIGRAAGLFLIIGGLLYVIGWIMWVLVQKDYWQPAIDLFPEGDAKDQFVADLNAIWYGQIGEALLAGVTSILLGIDAMLQWYDEEFKRLSSNLGLIMAVSVLASSVYYIQLCSEEEADLGCETPDGVVAIATGYAILFVASLVYTVLYICSCCTCGCKDNCLVRVILAVALVIGGVLCSIGYWVYSGADADIDTDTDQGKRVFFYIGYTILVGGLPIVWALDIALDDVKNSK